MNRPCAVLSMLAAMGVIAVVTPSLAEPRAVVELFTSQGCSSCPPADKLVGELAADRAFIVMSLPIDYWDYLGWKDTLAQPRHTARQRGYAAKRGDREVYTPQVVVNGVAQVLGSDRSAIEDAARTVRRNAAASVPVTLTVQPNHIEISVASVAKADVGGEVWLCGIAKSIPVIIKRGENRGRTITYHNVVRRWVRLGVWSGESQSWSLSKSELAQDGVDSIAVLVQSGSIESPSAILGAAAVPIH